MEPSGSLEVHREFNDLTFLRFSDVDPLLLCEGDNLSPVTIYDKLCEIRRYYNKMAVDAMKKGNVRLVIWHRAQCRLLDSQIDTWHGIYIARSRPS